MRAFLISLFCLSFVFITAIPANAAVKRAYAGIVVDAKSGKTLYSRAADSPRYPASVTKVMTLYIVFQELSAGRMKLSTRMRVSKFASNAVPSKLGLRVGSTISVENAIKSLVTKSANDVARVIAEHISGSEAKFAVRMTKTARALGMKRTTYANASGLPNSKQITTVRDQSRLGIAVYQHFPKYYKYFQTRSFKYKGKTYGNHNRLLGQNGIDGIKTGYIRASGFNLLTAARKNNRHIVVVAFGFDSGTQRNAKVAALVKTNLNKARRGGYVAQARIAKPRIGGGAVTRVAAIPVNPMPRLERNIPLVIATPKVPAVRIPAVQTPAVQAPPIILASLPNPTSPTPLNRPINLLGANTINIPVAPKPTRINLASIPQVKTNKPSAPQIASPIDIIGQWITDTRVNSNGALALMPPSNIGSNRQINQANQNLASQAIDLMTSGAIGDEKIIKKVQTGWLIQVGAMNSSQGASSLLENATNQLPELLNRRSDVQNINKNGREIYRARFVGFGSKANAQSACNKLKERNINCLLVQS